MNDNFLKLVEKIKNHQDPDEAVRIALEVVTAYLEQNQLMHTPSADFAQEYLPTIVQD